LNGSVLRPTQNIAVTSLILLAVSGTMPALAQDTPPTATTTPTFSAVLAASGITISGYLDASYEHFNGEALLSSNVASRTFDTRPNSVSLNQAAVTIAYQPKEGFGAVLNLIAGQDADIFAPYDINPGAHSKFDFPQAYVQYVGGPVTVIAGRYVTLAGAETIDPRTNSNFSRSILYGFAIPFAHTGVRATYAVSDQLSLILGVTNGWDTLKDTNTAKTAELGIAFTPSKTFSLLAQSYVGKERVGGLVPSGAEGMRTLIDVVGTWNATDALTLSLNYDWGRQEGAAGTGLTVDNVDKAAWSGLAGYVNYQLNDQWRTSLRLEYFDDKDGYRSGIAQKWKEGTFTVGYSPTKPVELRLEFRYDSSDVPAFVHSLTTSGEGAPDLSGNQTSIGIEALYKF
jgi:Putative beta-barrel porin-2, OmpL-like. bbp2